MKPVPNPLLLVLAVTLLLVATNTGQPDTLVTIRDSRFEGSVSEDADGYTLTAPGGGTMKFPKNIVKEVIRKPVVKVEPQPGPKPSPSSKPTVKDFQARFTAAEKDAMALARLAAQCEQEELTTQAEQAEKAALKLAPADAAVREALGYVRVQDAWHKSVVAGPWRMAVLSARLTDSFASTLDKDRNLRAKEGEAVAIVKVYFEAMRNYTPAEIGAMPKDLECGMATKGDYLLLGHNFLAAATPDGAQQPICLTCEGDLERNRITWTTTPDEYRKQTFLCRKGGKGIVTVAFATPKTPAVLLVVSPTKQESDAKGALIRFGNNEQVSVVYGLRVLSVKPTKQPKGPENLQAWQTDFAAFVEVANRALKDGKDPGRLFPDKSKVQWTVTVSSFTRTRKAVGKILRGPNCVDFKEAAVFGPNTPFVVWAELDPAELGKAGLLKPGHKVRILGELASIYGVRMEVSGERVVPLWVDKCTVEEVASPPSRK